MLINKLIILQVALYGVEVRCGKRVPGVVRAARGGKDDTSPMSQTKRDYEVGRGKPPVHSRFKKGQSGNPRGRPAKNLAVLLAAALNETVTVTEDKQTPASHQARGGDC
jgi:Family of unknown function (DUF5681)